MTRDVRVEVVVCRRAGAGYVAEVADVYWQEVTGDPRTRVVTHVTAACATAQAAAAAAQRWLAAALGLEA